MVEVILDRKEKSAEGPSLSLATLPPPLYRDRRHSPPRRSSPPPPSPYKRLRMDDGRNGRGFEHGDTRDTKKILLCNPAIREFNLLQGSCFGSNFGTHIMTGFGYDAISNVYKVVRIVHLHCTDVGVPIGAEVCTLGRNNGDSWREIKMNIEIDSTSHTHSEVYDEGVFLLVSM
ncbi:hypothetical protein L484_007125 [Morus notabilis]|uniref:F-box associated beta-propeller type 3 domain-containing protein n=1 Tax=Morus notabilis TaxID=981085 RepID=W9SIC0_9ROSA|nr:hypothetical protein L484_007125 [Morus notabilis]